MTSNPHDILGVSLTASLDEIRQAYKARLLETHPDKRHGSRSAFEAVHFAYQQLTSLKPSMPSVVYDTIKLSDMDADDINAIYPCRCGGSFVFPLADVGISTRVIIPCQSCSLSLCIVDDSSDS